MRSEAVNGVRNKRFAGDMGVLLGQGASCPFAFSGCHDQRCDVHRFGIEPIAVAPQHESA